MKNPRKSSSANISPRKKARKSRCSVCASLFSKNGLQALNSSTGFSHRTFEEYKSTLASCDFCNFIFGLAVDGFGHSWLPNTHLVFRNKNEPRVNVKSIINALEGSIEGSDGTITIYPFAKENDPLSTMIPRRPLCRDVKSSHVFNEAKKLINTCLSPKDPSLGHQRCRYSGDNVLPTRVIRINDRSVQLQINKTDRRGSYLALSYCWGNPDPNKQTSLYKLHNDNLDRLVEAIRVDELEQSVQDAINVTRQLGYTYLWIDRLCIIQDCEIDMAHEISRMATIYKNADVTIAAGTSERAAEGFLGTLSTNAPYLPSSKFSIPMENGRKGTVYLSGKAYEPNHALDKRGWTMQEYMLSSRMLIFSDYQLLWQCQEIELQSVTGDEQGLEYQQHLESLPWAAFDDGGEPAYGTHDSDKLYLWKTIIMQYTRRNLKVSDDRLPAVTGITTALQKVWGDSHIYGHWQQWFIELLAWQIPEDSRVKDRRLNRAPSWSWVSVDGEIEFKDPIIAKDAIVKTLTARMVTISCKILMYEEMDDADWSTLSQDFDLVDSALTQEFGDRQPEYLLLGSTTTCDTEERGLGLIVLRTDNGTYRRVGVAAFSDMSIWDQVSHRVVELEPKQK
ncbi:hypothetical protein FHETE_7434 [Fusarium heterosporum]|uniref:Heterokaryon incompatibility domain-containing protein n=1 Tax=Fusarium heterosporum TaxID=42747 RepID=A0A8H5T147_FUSHE|nr:hypothetical protein FHETE_7434 [Fusarium heterosporum]